MFACRCCCCCCRYSGKCTLLYSVAALFRSQFDVSFRSQKHKEYCHCSRNKNSFSCTKCAITLYIEPFQFALRQQQQKLLGRHWNGYGTLSQSKQNKTRRWKVKLSIDVAWKQETWISIIKCTHCTDSKWTYRYSETCTCTYFIQILFVIRWWWKVK